MTGISSGTAGSHADRPGSLAGQAWPGGAGQGGPAQGTTAQAATVHGTAAQDAAGSWRAILSGRRGRLLAGLMLTEFAAAVQILIVITVLPAAVRQLGGIRLYGLALSVAAVAGIGTAPIAVRVLDRLGARSVVWAGAVLFSCGALGAGLASRMAELVAARFAEGGGAAALGAVAITGVSSLYEQAQRPKVMVLSNLAWAIPSIAGPALGSLAVATVGWRWAFTAQLPLMVVAMALAAPGLGLLGPAAGRREPSRAAPSALLVAGLLAVLAGPAAGGPAGTALTAAGAILALVAARRILPPGMLALRPGLPIAAMALLCCSFA